MLIGSEEGGEGDVANDQVPVDSAVVNSFTLGSLVSSARYLYFGNRRASRFIRSMRS